MNQAGLSKHPLYILWHGMRQRCINKKDAGYHRYGARGIEVKWKSYKEFFNDMSASYEKHVKQHGRDNTSLDRINNDGDYCKDNCHWTTWKKQAKNRCTTVNIRHKGVTKILRDWATDNGIHPTTLWRRLNVMKLPMAKALMPHVPRNSKVLSKSGFVGVSTRNDGSFQSSIRVNGKRKHLGTFKSPSEAAEAYSKASKALLNERNKGV